ncbi:9379_t:CDS:2 [Cetraspora pellucida]|uniref:9379_t:CDS:1 n=1 Tax=Cetraspora pellucida TaxID=1433469 RepID=A0A9N9HX90_9GLOM|nr:9379_t:CDS:2 [Cetraspora pellucida]
MVMNKRSICVGSQNQRNQFAVTNIVHIEQIDGTPDYCYTIDEVNVQKCSKFIKKLMHNEAIKNYYPLVITNFVQNKAKKVYENLGIEYLKTQKVTNSKFNLVGLMNLHFIDQSSLKANITDTVKFLIKKNYQVE